MSRHNTPGNAAAMREALAEARKVIKAMGGYWAMVTLPIIDAALSAPPRQCDVGTAEEQDERFRDFCPKYTVGGLLDCEGCRLYGTPCADCALALAQTPYSAQEGGAK